MICDSKKQVYTYPSKISIKNVWDAFIVQHRSQLAVKNWVAFVKYISTNKRFKKLWRLEEKITKDCPTMWVYVCWNMVVIQHFLSLIHCCLALYFLRLSLLCVAIIHSMMWFCSSCPIDMCHQTKQSACEHQQWSKCFSNNLCMHIRT